MHDIIIRNGLSDAGALPGRLVRALPTPLSVIPAPFPSFPRKREPPPHHLPSPLPHHSRHTLPSFPPPFRHSRVSGNPHRTTSQAPYPIIPAPHFRHSRPTSRHSRVSGNPPRATSQAPYPIIPAPHFRHSHPPFPSFPPPFRHSRESGNPPRATSQAPPRDSRLRGNDEEDPHPNHVNHPQKRGGGGGGANHPRRAATIVACPRKTKPAPPCPHSPPPAPAPHCSSPSSRSQPSPPQFCPPPPPVNAAPPGDLTLTLSLIEDSDDIVPPGGAARVRAALSSTTRDPEVLNISGALRVSGTQEWEHDGRNSFPVSRVGSAGVPGAATGRAVDVQQRSAADGGDIIAVGAPWDDVLDADGDPLNAAGSVDLFVNGSFVKRLTAPTPAANHRFGHDVAVGGGLILVGAPGANRAYLYNPAGELVATFSRGGTDPLSGLGTGVAIDDAGETIVVTATGGYDGEANDGAGYIFIKPSTGWADAGTVWTAAVLGVLTHKETGKNIGASVAISGDGNVIALGAPFRDTDANSPTNNDRNGGVLVFVKGSAWPTSSPDQTPNARLLAESTRANARVGRSVDLNYDGSVIVASGHGDYGTTSIRTGWKGAAFVWLKGSSWSGVRNNAIALTDSHSAFGDQFGHSVAISDSGKRVVVSNAWKQAGSYQAGDAHVFEVASVSDWAADSAADTVLTSPQSEAQLFFGSGLALDGENTLVVGQTERTNFLTTNIFTGHGRAYAFDLAAANPQASAALIDIPLTCTDRELNDQTTWTCPVDVQVTPEGEAKQDPRIVVPLGTPEDSFTISATLTVDGVRIIDTLEVTIGTVDEVHSASFDFATNLGVADTSDDDKPYDDTIAAGDATRLQLGILNENGKAAAANNVSAVLFTSSGGALSLVSSPGAATGACANNTCQITVSSLNAANSDKIIVQLDHPGQGKSGTATVRAQIISNAGKTLQPDARTVTFSGPVDTIAIAEPATGVLSTNTTRMLVGENDDAEEDAAETRDRLRLSVSAQDKSGNKADTPTNLVRITITDPDGKPVSADNIARTFPLQNADDEDIVDANDNPQLELDVNAPPATPLKSGEYTIELRAGGKTTTQTFTVSGGPANVAISEPDGELTVNGQFTITATLTDAAGAAVPDGTPLSFEANPTGTVPVLVNLSRGSTTKDGQATATYLVITAGRGYVTVTSGTASNAALITTTAAAPATPTAPTNPADSLSTTRANAFSTWLGEGTTTASQLLEGLANDIDTILLWTNGQWTRYALADGREIPDSINFEITTGAILWLGNSG